MNLLGNSTLSLLLLSSGLFDLPCSHKLIGTVAFSDPTWIPRERAHARAKKFASLDIRKRGEELAAAVAASRPNPIRAAPAGKRALGDILSQNALSSIESGSKDGEIRMLSQMEDAYLNLNGDENPTQPMGDAEAPQETQEERPDLKPHLLTLTVKNGDDLAERQAHLTKSLRS